MPNSPNVLNALKERYVFNATIDPLLRAAVGVEALPVPQTRINGTCSRYHAIINVRNGQTKWLDVFFEDKSDEESCEYILAKLRKLLDGKPVTTTYEGLINRTDLLHPGDMVQIDVKRVTCFTDGGHRRFVAHFDAFKIIP